MFTINFILFSSFILILFHAWYDSQVNIEGAHFKRTIIRILLVSTMVLWNWKLIPLIISMFWLIFDFAYNFFRGNDWNYIGKEAWLDRQWNNNWKLQYLLKIIVFIVTCFYTFKYIDT